MFGKNKKKENLVPIGGLSVDSLSNLISHSPDNVKAENLVPVVDKAGYEVGCEGYVSSLDGSRVLYVSTDSCQGSFVLWFAVDKVGDKFKDCHDSTHHYLKANIPADDAVRMWGTMLSSMSSDEYKVSIASRS